MDIIRNIDFWCGEPYGYRKEYDTEINKGLPRLDFIPCEKENAPCMLIFPGGGYSHLADHEGENIAVELNKVGISCFVLYYRVLPYAFPVYLYEARRAMRYIRFNSKEYNIDPDKIGVMGFSAGANLACVLTEQYDRFDDIKKDDIDKVSALPNALGLCYPVISIVNEEFWHKGSGDNFFGGSEKEEELRYKLSCELNVRDEMPPVFLWHTVQDKSVSCINSLEMATALKKKNIPFELHIFPEGGHGKDFAKGIPGTEQWFGLYLDWLKRVGF